MDLDTFITTLYVVIDDWYQSEMAEQLRRARGPAPKMTDSEVLTIAVAGQWRVGVPWQSERGVVRYMTEHGEKWFKSMLSRSRFNERVRDLWALVIQLQQVISEYLNEDESPYEVVDCLPLPSCSNSQSLKKGHWLWWGTRGHGGTQGKWYWGDQLIMSVRHDHIITGWLVGPANADDRAMLQGLLSYRHGHQIFHAPEPWRPWRQVVKPTFLGPQLAVGQPNSSDYYLADKGFNGFKWQRHWYQQFETCVVTEPARNAASGRLPRSWQKWFRGMRQAIETTFSVLTQVFDIKRLNAHSRWGQYTRLALAATAFNFGIWINRSMGRPDLSHATLIC